MITVDKVDVGSPLLNPWRNEIIESSRDVWIGRRNGEIALVWGLIPGSLLSESAYIWSIATPEIKRCPKAMLQISRRWVGEMLREFTTLTGFCERRTVWLDHLGAEYIGSLGAYHEFTIRAE